MAALPGQINTNETVRTMPEGTPLPPGIYRGIVTKTGQRETAGKNGNPGGIMVEVELDITAPEEFANAGRKFWDRFNIVNASAEASRIGREGLADLAKACGYEIIEDDEQLIGREVIMKLVVDPAKPYEKNGVKYDGKPQNRCLKYWHIDTNVEEAEQQARAAKGATAAKPASASSAPAAGAASGARKWGPADKAQATTTQPAAAATTQPAAAPAAAAGSTPAAAPSGGAPWKKRQ